MLIGNGYMTGQTVALSGGDGVQLSRVWLRTSRA